MIIKVHTQCFVLSTYFHLGLANAKSVRLTMADTDVQPARLSHALWGASRPTRKSGNVTASGAGANSSQSTSSLNSIC